MKALRWLVPFAMLSLVLVGCGSGEPADDASKTLPASETTADASKPASSTNAGTQAPATPQ